MSQDSVGDMRMKSAWVCYALCLGVTSIDPHGEPLREWVMSVSYYSAKFYTIFSSSHTHLPSPRDLDLPLS